MHRVHIQSHSQTTLSFSTLSGSGLGTRLVKVRFSHLSICRQCDVLIVSIAAVLYHQHWRILHGAHQEHISAEGRQ